jgi:protein gp37
MSETEIQWTWRQSPSGEIVKGYTFNPWWGCLKVSEECKHCYAEDIAHHYGHNVWGPATTTSRRFFKEKHWQEPLVWNRQAEKQGHRRSVFCASMADVYEDHPMLSGPRERLWKLIDATPWLNWLLLTKRPENVLAMSPWGINAIWPDNVWIGTSVGLQERAEERIPSLLEVPAVVRFLSCEPLLGPVDLSPWISQLHWVISGGESGQGARPLDLDWVRALREQCQEAGIAYFFKQVGGRYHGSGGRELDGRTWDDLPSEVPVELVSA